ncbi:hypothetical protein N2152v2_003586 [Parachlorella kessleri]
MSSSKSPSKAQATKELFAKLTLKAKQVVLNLSDVAVKTLEATNNEKWGPHGQLLNDIAEGSYDAEKFKEVWEVLRKRITEGVGEKWRLTYKSLLVIEFLVKQSSQHVVQVVLENVGIFQDLQKYQYKDEAGKDWGINVRNRAKELCALLGNSDRIREERAKAKANKEKYKGLGRDAAGAAGGVGSFEAGEQTKEEYGGYGPQSTYYKGAKLVANQSDAGEEPVTAASDRIDSFNQDASPPKSAAPAAKMGPASSTATAAAISRGIGTPTAAATTAADAFDAFPAEQPMPAAVKPSLRALSETHKAAPRKLGDVRVDPSIAASFGGLKLASPTITSGVAASSPKVSAPQPSTLSPAAALFDAFADFGSPAPSAAASPAPAAPLASSAAPEDPFAVLSGNRESASPMPQTFSNPSIIKATGMGGNNPFSTTPTINLTATVAPLPEAMFSAPTGPLFGLDYGSQNPAATRTAMPSPAMKAGIAKPASPPKLGAAAHEDPFSAFNPFK